MSFFKNLKDVATTAKNTASSTLSDASSRPGTLGKLASYGSRGLEGITRATDHVSGAYSDYARQRFQTADGGIEQG